MIVVICGSIRKFQDYETKTEKAWNYAMEIYKLGVDASLGEQTKDYSEKGIM